MAATSEVMVERYREDGQDLWDGNYMVTPRVTGELLAASYLRWKDEGLIPWIFYGPGTADLRWFVNTYMNTEQTVVLACFRKKMDGELEQIGCGWVNNRESVGGAFVKAEVGHGYFRAYHDGETTTRCAKLLAEYIFRCLGVDILFGVTPEKNRAAVLIARRVGFEMIDKPIPKTIVFNGKPCGVYVSWLTKEHWEELKLKEAHDGG